MQFYDNVENIEIEKNPINDHVFLYSLGFFYFDLAKGWFLSLQSCCSVNLQVYEIIKSVFRIDKAR